MKITISYPVLLIRVKYKIPKPIINDANNTILKSIITILLENVECSIHSSESDLDTSLLSSSSSSSYVDDTDADLNFELLTVKSINTSIEVEDNENI